MSADISQQAAKSWRRAAILLLVCLFGVTTTFVMTVRDAITDTDTIVANYQGATDALKGGVLQLRECNTKLFEGAAAAPQPDSSLLGNNAREVAQAYKALIAAHGECVQVGLTAPE